MVEALITIQMFALVLLAFWLGTLWTRRHGKPHAYIAVMKTSAGNDYYVTIRCGDRTLTPHMYREQWKAQYDVADWVWLFNGGKKASLIDYMPDLEDGANDGHVSRTKETA